jgi:hypothetical protein
MVRAAGISTFSKAMMDIYERLAVGWRASISSGNFRRSAIHVGRQICGSIF